MSLFEDTVSVVILETKHSRIVYTGVTPDAVQSELNDWVQKHWADYYYREDMPDDPDQARNKFFDYTRTEYPRYDMFEAISVNYGDQ